MPSSLASHSESSEDEGGFISDTEFALMNSILEAPRDPEDGLLPYYEPETWLSHPEAAESRRSKNKEDEAFNIGRNGSEGASINPSGSAHLLVQLSMRQAFKILCDAMEGYLDPIIPVRTRASPINPDISCFFVCADPELVGNSKELDCSDDHGLNTSDQYVRNGLREEILRRLKDDHMRSLRDTGSKNKKRKRNSMHQSEISVKFQSFHEKNSEMWWSPDYKGLLGVAARAMSKTSRPIRQGVDEDDLNKKPLTNRRHGYAGRLFTLIKRSPRMRDKGDVLTNIRSLLVADVPSLVQFWKLDDPNFTIRNMPNNHDETTSVGIESSATSSVLSSNDTAPKEGNSDGINGNFHGLGDLFVNGDLCVKCDSVVRNLHVKGNLLVEGSISGLFVTPQGAADYAEWFAFLDPDENLQPGMVVQLRSPEQMITLNTSKHGPYLVISTTPCIAAGVPPTSHNFDSVPGALCAFIGQVPVKVHGPVECGDLLFPSGLNDGFAISHKRKKEMQAGSLTSSKQLQESENESEPIGTVMVPCGDGDHSVLTFVRWQHNLKYQILKQQRQNFQNSISNMWIWTMACIFEFLINVCYLYNRPHLWVARLLVTLDILTGVFAVSHFPKYKEFIQRGDMLLYVAVSVAKALYFLYGLCLYISYTESFDVRYGPADMFVAVLNIMRAVGSTHYGLTVASNAFASFPEI